MAGNRNRSNTRIIVAVSASASVVIAGLVAQHAPAGEPCEPLWDSAIGEPGMSGGLSPIGVLALAEYDGDLVAGGQFTHAGGVEVNRLARWDPSSSMWHSIGGGVTGGFSPGVEALAIFDADLIVAGRFNEAGGVNAARIARWDGEQWHDLNGGVPTGWVAALAVYNGDLIAAGSFAMAGDVPASLIARWDGAQWHPLGEGLLLEDPDDKFGYPGEVLSMAVYDGDLYVTGWFTLAGGQPVNSVARWDGSQWHSHCCGGSVFSVFNGKLIGGSTQVTQWDGSTLEVIGASSGQVWTLGEYDGDLIAGGTFTTMDGVPATRIARWDGVSWHPMGDGLNHAPLALTSHAGQLVAGGWFTEVEGTAVGHIAAWDGCIKTPTTPGDLTGDGTVGVPDLLILLSQWGPCADCGDCPADLTNSCAVGVADLLVLLENWG